MNSISYKIDGPCVVGLHESISLLVPNNSSSSLRRMEDIVDILSKIVCVTLANGRVSSTVLKRCKTCFVYYLVHDF